MNSGVIPNNPAGRLLNFLRRAQSLHATNTTQVGEQLVKLFPFARAKDDLLTFLQEMNVIVGLVDEISQRLSICDEQHLAIFRQSEPTLKGLVRIVPLEQPWANYAGQWIRATDLLALQYADLALQRNFPEPVVSIEEIDQIRSKIEHLFEMVSGANLPYGLKNLIIDSLLEISKALSEYELRGGKGLDQALSQVIGRATLHQEFAPTRRGTEEQKADVDDEWRSSFWSVMAEVAEVIDATETLRRFVSLIQRGGSATEDAPTALTGGTPASEEALIG